MEYCSYSPCSTLGKRDSFEVDENNTNESIDNCTRLRLKGRRVQSFNSNSEVFAIYNFDDAPAQGSQGMPMDVQGEKRVLSLTWEQFQAMDKKLCSGMCVRIVAP